MARSGRAVAQPGHGPGLLCGGQIVGASHVMLRSMTRIVRVGWGRTPPSTSTWLASQLGPRRNRRPEVFPVAEPLCAWAQLVADR
eukprot:6232621-Pyramimonas_sp.AAC.1